MSEWVKESTFALQLMSFEIMFVPCVFCMRLIRKRKTKQKKYSGHIWLVPPFLLNTELFDNHHLNLIGWFRDWTFL